MEPIALIDFAKKIASRNNEHTEEGILARAFMNAYLALSKISEYNRIGNDLDAYLFDLSEWGMGERRSMPMPSEYGL